MFIDSHMSAKLIAYAQELGISLSDDSAMLLLRHLDLVFEKNATLNLTRITDPSEALFKHIVDSLLFAAVLQGRGKESRAECMPQPMVRGGAAGLPSQSQHVRSDISRIGIGATDRISDCGSNPCTFGPSRNDARFVDVGTGAGFPGIPFAVASGMSGLLIDSVTKKVHAVEEFIARLGLTNTLTARAIRAEELAVSNPRAFEFVVARAVARSSVLVEYAAPLLAMGGVLLISKANIDADEDADALRTAELCGMRGVFRKTYDLPENAGKRVLIAFEKVDEPQVKLPRRPGIANKRSLWNK